ncbi:MAG: polyprenyl synthetase family protein [Muribaculaceae bacterium]|nr:polyprenyl synthetase family protein [Muribaculaceae bacterium]
MTTLTQIKSSIAPELVQLNAIIKDMLDSPSELTNTIVEHYLRTKGKQLRPIMVLLSGRLFGGITERVLYAAAGIEMLHNASLIHDDVIDQSRERRGIATINSIWDNHVAVLVGDYFVGGALKCAVKVGDMRVLKVLSRLGIDLSLGEIDQIDIARSRNIAEQTYMNVIDRKTASLFTCCVEVGALAVDAPEEPSERLKKFARLLGLCFQIKDDTFDYFNDPVVGKPTGNDLREGKITLPLIHALTVEHPMREKMLELTHKTELNDAEIEQLVEYAKECGGIDYAYKVMDDLSSQAEAILDTFEPCPTIEDFRAILHYIIERNK